jgi:hypothetical protein
VTTPEDAKLIETGVKAATSEALRPFTDLITKLFGPAAEEIGLGLSVGLAAWRMKRQIRFWKQTQDFIADSGFEPLPVAPKMLFPIIQNASLEDNDDLQDRWAALLANAANPEFNPAVHPSYSDVLRYLSANDVRFLELVFVHCFPEGQTLDVRFPPIQLFVGDADGLFELYSKVFPPPQPSASWQKLTSAHTVASIHYSSFMQMLDTFVALRLFDDVPHINLHPDNSQTELMRYYPRTHQQGYYLTALGYSFIQACRPPTTSTPRKPD